MSKKIKKILTGKEKRQQSKQKTDIQEIKKVGSIKNVKA